MVRARNTTTDATFEAEAFDEAFKWGVAGLPGPYGDLEAGASGYQAEFDEHGRTCFDDCQGRTYAETVEIWNPDIWGDEPPEEW